MFRTKKPGGPGTAAYRPDPTDRWLVGVAVAGQGARLRRMERQRRYAGLTATQRLNMAGLRAEFDAAALARNRSEMIRLLVEVEVSDAS